MLFKLTTSVSSGARQDLSEEQYLLMSDAIRAFIVNKDFFEEDYLRGDETRVAFDYVETMVDEEHGL